LTKGHECFDSSVLIAAGECLLANRTLGQVKFFQPIAAVDGVMSVATFHWITDHTALFANLADAMRQGAPLVSESGGAGNVAGVNQAVARMTGNRPTRGSFPGAEEAAARLDGAGFEVRDVRLREDPFRCDNPRVLEEFLATVILGSPLDNMPVEDREHFVRAVREALEEPEVDYIRLEIDALRR